MAKEMHAPDVGVILEDIDSKFDQMLEGLQGVQKQVDDHHQEFREFREETNYKFEVVYQEFDKVHKEFGKVYMEFDKVYVEFDKVHEELEHKVDRSELEARVGTLEKKIA